MGALPRGTQSVADLHGLGIAATGEISVDLLALFAIIALPLVVILLLVLLRPTERIRAYRFGGLLWLVGTVSYRGPCCKSCQIQYSLLPVFRSPEGTAYYELYCLFCQKPFPGRAFTVQELLDIDKQVGARLKSPRESGLLATVIHEPVGRKPSKI